MKRKQLRQQKGNRKRVLVDEHEGLTTPHSNDAAPQSSSEETEVDTMMCDAVNDGIAGDSDNGEENPEAEIDDKLDSNDEENRGEEEESEEESEEEEDVVEPKILPERITRGRRLQTLVGEDAEVDNEFWGHSTWNEEASDEDWVPGEDERVEDSTGSESDSSTETDTTTDDEAAEKEIELEAKKSQARYREARRRVIYRDPAKASSQANPQRAPQHPQARPLQRKRAARPLPPPAARSRTSLPDHIEKQDGKATRGAVLSQEDHLRLAELNEKQNTKHLNERIDLGNWKKAVKDQKESSTIWVGPMELLIFWSSDRLIEHEEQNKESKDAKRTPICAPRDTPTSHSPPYCRQLLFFVDFDHPEATKIPDMYLGNDSGPDEPAPKMCSVYPSQRAKYRDPRTGKYFSNANAFRELRRKYDTEAMLCIKEYFGPVEKKLGRVLSFFRRRNILASLFQTPDLVNETVTSSVAQCAKEPGTAASSEQATSQVGSAIDDSARDILKDLTGLLATSTLKGNHSDLDSQPTPLSVKKKRSETIKVSGVNCNSAGTKRESLLDSSRPPPLLKSVTSTKPQPADTSTRQDTSVQRQHLKSDNITPTLWRGIVPSVDARNQLISQSIPAAVTSSLPSVTAASSTPLQPVTLPARPTFYGNQQTTSQQGCYVDQKDFMFPQVTYPSTPFDEVQLHRQPLRIRSTQPMHNSYTTQHTESGIPQVPPLLLPYTSEATTVDSKAYSQRLQQQQLLHLPADTLPSGLPRPATHFSSLPPLASYAGMNPYAYISLMSNVPSSLYGPAGFPHGFPQGFPSFNPYGIAAATDTAAMAAYGPTLSSSVSSLPQSAPSSLGFVPHVSGPPSKRSYETGPAIGVSSSVSIETQSPDTQPPSWPSHTQHLHTLSSPTSVVGSSSSYPNVGGNPDATSRSAVLPRLPLLQYPNTITQPPSAGRNTPSLPCPSRLGFPGEQSSGSGYSMHPTQVAGMVPINRPSPVPLSPPDSSSVPTRGIMNMQPPRYHHPGLFPDGSINVTRGFSTSSAAPNSTAEISSSLAHSATLVSSTSKP